MNLEPHTPAGLGGALGGRCPWYVERAEDSEVRDRLLGGESCYVRTSHQMGKSSMIVRLTHQFRDRGVPSVALDLAAMGCGLSPDQWCDAVALQIGRKLGREDEMDHALSVRRQMPDFTRLGTAIERIALPAARGRLILLVDEADMLRSLAFSPAGFFALLRAGTRAPSPQRSGLVSCLFATLPPASLASGAAISCPGSERTVALHDFRLAELLAIVPNLGRCLIEHSPIARAEGQLWVEALLRRVLRRSYHWTLGHPYLTQKLGTAAVRKALENQSQCRGAPAEGFEGAVDAVCEELFLGENGRQSDCNLAIIRDRLLGDPPRRASMLRLFRSVRTSGGIRFDPSDPAAEYLARMGAVRIDGDQLKSRNPIYERVFDLDWIELWLRTGEPAACAPVFAAA